jgi:predicted Zn-dependent protease
MNPLKQAIQQIDLTRSSSGSRFPGLEWAGYREVREHSTLRAVRDGKPEANSTHVSHGVMAEVLVDGQFAYASTTRLDPESLLAATERAHAQARRAASRGVHRFTARERPDVRDRYATRALKPVGPNGAMSAGEITDLLVRITERLKAKSGKIVRASATSETVRAEMRYVSTHGADAEQEFSLITSEFEATAQDGPITQRRTNGGMRGNCRQGGWENFADTPELWAVVDQVGDQALELLSAEQCPTDTRSLLVMPDQMMLQIHESIGHPLELDRILGDERNYAGWSFVKLEDFGHLQYGSPLMHVTFDPTVEGEFASYSFDDVGNPARREHLIEGGVLKRALGGLESQARARVPGVANSRASSWNRAPIDRMANINLEPGATSLEDMIAGVERGILMESNRSWSIDDFRNKFQFGCEYARLIENGRLTRVVRNPNYRGITVPFWKSLVKVGDRSTMGVYGTPNCGKGEPNQVIRVGHASPACLFENIEVFGGAE